MQGKQRGFTLIELIMVIVLLGILAAFALPKFADFGRDARIAVVQNAMGTARSAALWHALHSWPQAWHVMRRWPWKAPLSAM